MLSTVLTVYVRCVCVHFSEHTKRDTDEIHMQQKKIYTCKTMNILETRKHFHHTHVILRIYTFICRKACALFLCCLRVCLRGHEHMINREIEVESVRFTYVSMSLSISNIFFHFSFTFTFLKEGVFVIFV
jgi:hypothetical protein